MPYGYKSSARRAVPMHPALEDVCIPRSVAEIDRDLAVEREIWIMVRRGREDCPEARGTKAQLDRLLDERAEAGKATAGVPARVQMSQARRPARP